MLASCVGRFKVFRYTSTQVSITKIFTELVEVLRTQPLDVARGIYVIKNSVEEPRKTRFLVDVCRLDPCHGAGDVKTYGPRLGPDMRTYSSVEP